MNQTSIARLLWPLVICAVATLIFLIRLHGSTDLESYGQPATIGRLLDLTTQGHYFVQRDLNGDMMVAPPFHTWLIAASTALFGAHRAALALPSFLSVLAIGLLLFAAGSRHFGEAAGGLAAIAFLLSPATAKQIALVSADPVFALAVTAAALAASAAVNTGADDVNAGRHWRLFWFASALATLAASVLGLLLAASGLLRCLWDKASDHHRPKVCRPAIAGFSLFVAPLLLWILPAVFDEGLGPVSRMLLPATASWEFGALLRPFTTLFARNLPFSLFAFFALWRIMRRPAAGTEERNFERFLAFWLTGGLLAVSFGAASGIDPVFALWPAGALLAGHEMARLADRMGRTKFAGVAVIVACLLVGATYNAVHSIGPAKLGTSVLAKELRLAADAESAASALKASGIDIHALTHLNTPETLQFYLGTFSPRIDRTRLVELLATRDMPLDLVTDGTGLKDIAGVSDFPNTQHIFRWPVDESLAPVVQVYRIAR